MTLGICPPTFGHFLVSFGQFSQWKIDSPIFFQPQGGRHSWLWISQSSWLDYSPTHLLLEVGWGNEPLKKWYFNFGGLFLSQKKIYIKKLNGIGFSYVWALNSVILKQFLKFHKVTAALWLPSSSFAIYLPPISPNLLSHFFSCISDGAVNHISPARFLAYFQQAAM